MPTGKIQIFNVGRGNGYIAPADGGESIFFELQASPQLGANDVEIGMWVEYQLHQRGNKVSAIRLKKTSAPKAAPSPAREQADTPVASRHQQTAQRPAQQDAPARPKPQRNSAAAIPVPRGYRFLNPYNFVRFLPLPAQPLAEGIDVELLGKVKPPPHDRWVGLSGRIKCTLKTVTPIFVSDAEKIEDDTQHKEHKHYQFFKWHGEKAIPASSLRGMTRNVFEVITNSCLANFTGARLSYRLEAGEARRLVPARIEKDGNKFQLHLLYGTAQLNPDYPPKIIYAGALREYKAAKQMGRKKQGPPPPTIPLRGKEHGEPCWAVMLQVKPPMWRVLALADSEQEANAKRLELQQQFAREHRDKERADTLLVKKGWLCITYQNTDNKHSERFFFADESVGGVQTLELDKTARENYESLIKDYQERHAPTIERLKEKGIERQALKKPWTSPKTRQSEMAFSRFILNLEKWKEGEHKGELKDGKVRGGELVYALLSGRGKNTRIEFLAPVSVPRVAYKHTVADLLEEHLRHCDDENALCPACRVFGWVRDEKADAKKGRRENNAYRGRVRFTHASLVKSGKKTEPMTLAVLGTPKPTTTRFYLAQPNSEPADFPRSDASAGYDGNEGNNQLRGRKMYWHHPIRDPRSLDPNFPFVQDKDKSDQNRTLDDPEGEDAEFEFTVEFENLAEVELGALLWALRVGGQGYHRLGYGKPLGLGSVKVEIQEKGVELFDPHARYSGVEDNGRRELKEWDAVAQRFERAVEMRWKKSFIELPNIQDLMALAGRREQQHLPVHYPFSPEIDFTKEDKPLVGRFEWFVGNKRKDGVRVEMGLAADDNGLPLIDRASKVYGE